MHEYDPHLRVGDELRICGLARNLSTYSGHGVWNNGDPIIRDPNDSTTTILEDLRGGRSLALRD